MSSKLTDFLQTYIADQVEQELYPLHLGFYTRKEKPFEGLRFDVYSYSRKRGIILIWEIETNNAVEACLLNVHKVQKILKFNMLPYVHMFHIFSPWCECDMPQCSKKGQKMKTKYPLRFTYNQFSIQISDDEFDRIFESFKRNQKRAEQEYGRKLRIHMGKIVRKSICLFTGK